MEWPSMQWTSNLCRYIWEELITICTDNKISKAFKHIFTSPSSIDQEPKATQSGNAHIHGMQAVMKASIAYVSTQVHQSPCHFVPILTFQNSRHALH